MSMSVVLPNSRGQVFVSGLVCQGMAVLLLDSGGQVFVSRLVRQGNVVLQRLLKQKIGRIG